MDLVAVAAVRDAVDTHGEHYLERVYTRSELHDCTGAGGVDHVRLAARFAAKEAVRKVLRPASGLAWNTVGVRRRGGGWADVELTGDAAALARAAGIDELSLSLTHEGEWAAAVVVAELGDT